MVFTIKVKLPRVFSFRHTVESHGWYDLAPFEHEAGTNELRYVFPPTSYESPISALIKKQGSDLIVELSEKPNNVDRIHKGVRHILRLDDEMGDFYRMLRTEERLIWVTKAKAGRLLRGESVWEDLVKTICTTNCSWALTKKMVGNLVEKLGTPAS